jgi:hypothetical protein
MYKAYESFFRYKLAIFIIFLVLRCIPKAVDFIPFYRNLWLFQQSDMKNAQCVYPGLTTKPKVIQNFTLFFQAVYFSHGTTKTMYTSAVKLAEGLLFQETFYSKSANFKICFCGTYFRTAHTSYFLLRFHVCTF